MSYYNSVGSTSASYLPQPNHSREYKFGDQSWRNLLSVVRKWKLSFDGNRDKSIKLFLMELDEKRKLSDMSDSEVLLCLPFVFKGMALSWCRNQIKKWQTWKEFYDDALYCFDDQFTERLRDDVRKRTQGRHEPVVEYISKLGTLMLLQEPEPNDAEKIGRFYRNMLPSLKKHMRPFGKITSIEEFYSRALEAERLSEKTRIDSSLALQGLEDSLSSKLKVQEARARLPEGLEEIISAMIDEKLKDCGIVSSKTGDNNGSASAVRRNERRRGPKGVNAKRGAY